MNAGARAAQLISQISKDFFITAAQAAVQKAPMDPESEVSTPVVAAKSDDDNSDDEAAGTAGGGEDEIYEVDRILQTKMQGRTRMFLVRWKNYGPEADSWEPKSMLMDGASEAVNEFMEEYEKEKAAKKKVGGKKRGRPPGGGSIRESSRSLSKVDDERDPPTPDSSESEDEDDDEGGYGSKRKRGRKSKKDKSKKSKGLSVSETRSVIPPPQRYTAAVNRQTPWFMDSSSDSDSEKQEKQPSPTISNISTPSTAANGQIPQKIRIKTPAPATPVTPVTPIENNLSCNMDSESKEEKKHKKEKHKKKHKRKLVFEGVFKRNPGDVLSFVAKSAEGDGEPLILSHEEAIETDSRSLARFLIEKIEFKSDGSVVVNGGSSSSRSRHS